MTQESLLSHLIKMVLEGGEGASAPTNSADGVAGKTKPLFRKKKRSKDDDDDEIEEKLEDMEQKFPVSHINQDNGLISYGFACVSKCMSEIEEAAADRESFVQTLERDYVRYVNLKNVKGSQTWLSKMGGGDTLLKSSRFMVELEKRPVLVRWNGELIILDGHHRMNKALERGFFRKKCYVFDVINPGDMK